MIYTVFTDGSGTTGGPAGIGYVALDVDGVIIEEGSLSLNDATNQQAEILAAAFALHNLPEGSEVKVVSDSEYLVRGWNEYLPAWHARGWRKKDGKTPMNSAHWRRLETAAARHASVSFTWTRGHDGNHGNERADELAGLARKSVIRSHE